MAELPAWPATECGEALRRLVAARRRRQLAIAALSLSAALPCVLTTVWTPPPLLVWNASASAPLGLYWVDRFGELDRGDFVIARTPLRVRRLAAERRYIPVNVPLVKRVAARPGDTVCGVGNRILVNGDVLALRAQSDPSGRTMPRWQGCRRLQSGQVLLLNWTSARSFDGRYFGPNTTSDIIGKASLLWRR